MARVKVTAGAAIVRLAEGGEQLLLRNATFPVGKCDEKDVQRLVGIGLIEVLPDPEPGPKAPARKSAPKSAETK